MKKIKKILILFFVFLFIASCGRSERNNSEIEFDCSDYESIDFESIAISEGIEAFIPYKGETILCSRADQKLSLYNKDGKVERQIPHNSFYGNLCMGDNSIYAYDYQKSAIVRIAEDGEFLSDAITIQNSISFHTIRNMVALNGKLYVLAIPFTADNTETFFDFGSEEFKDYGEVLYSIDVENGQYRTLDLEHISAEYVSEDGRLFFYGWKEDKYYLYEYDTEKDKITKKITSDEMKNLMSIVVEGGYLFGISSSEGLVAINLEIGEKVESIEKVYAMFGNDLQFYRGNLFANNLAEGEIQRLFTIDKEGQLTATITDSETIPEKEETGKGESVVSETPSPKPTSLPKSRERIGLSYAGNLNVLTDEIQRVSGLRTKHINQSLDWEALIAEMMAGNPDVDIYVLSYGVPLTQRIRDLGLYEPLNDSEIISDYLEKCFAYVQKAATADNGDIWMMPLHESTMATLYVPENMEKLGVKPEELGTVDSYIAVLERLQGKLGKYQYFNNAVLFMDRCELIYEMSYNNYETGEINFDTPLYRHFAELFWTGWDRYGSAEANHPLFFKLEQLGQVWTKRESPDFNRDTVIFKTIPISDHLIKMDDLRSSGYLAENQGVRKEEFKKLLEGWRVLPFPKLQSDSEKNPVGMAYAFINPYSKQKEAALEYLEIILENQDAFVRMPLFFREDMEYYEQYYDTSMPVFQDIYEIFKNSDIYCRYSWDSSDEYITDYQHGLISFDEAIELRQKRAVTGLEE